MVVFAEIDPAYGPLQDHGAELAGQRATDALQVAGGDQMILERGDHAAAVEGFAQQQGTAVAGGALTAQINADRATEGGRHGDTVSPIADGSLESGSWRNALISQGNTIRYLRFQATLMNILG